MKYTYLVLFLTLGSWNTLSAQTQPGLEIQSSWKIKYNPVMQLVGVTHLGVEKIVAKQ